MEKVIITENDIMNAKPSIALVTKWALAKYIADTSVMSMKIAVKEDGKESIPLPDLFQRQTMAETQLKTGVFVKEYLGRGFDPVHEPESGKEIPYLMATDEVDLWSDFETQIDRLKKSKNKEVSDKCYEILNDYHAFCRMVSIEIEQELQIKNDLLGRAAWFLSTLVTKVTTDELSKMVQEYKPSEGESPVEQEAAEQANENETPEE